jgi:drug/metabolite transporter (DMT)-like permease
VADLALLLLTVFWGTTFLLVKNALAGTSTGLFLLLRFGLAALVLGSAWLWRRDRPTPGLWRDGLKLGLVMWAGFALQTFGLRHTTPSRSAFLTALAVLFVPFLARFLHGRRVLLSSWVGVGLAVAGLTFLYRESLSEAARFGDLLTLGCAVAYAFQIVWAGEFSPRHRLLPLTFLQVAVTFAGSALLLPLEPPRLGGGAGLWGSVVFLAVAMTAGALFVMNWAQRRTTAVRAALIYSLEPVTASLFSWGFGGEVLGRSHLLGGALIALGVVVGEVGSALAARWRSLSAG